MLCLVPVNTVENLIFFLSLFPDKISHIHLYTTFLKGGASNFILQSVSLTKELNWTPAPVTFLMAFEV